MPERFVRRWTSLDIAAAHAMVVWLIAMLSGLMCRADEPPPAVDPANASAAEQPSIDTTALLEVMKANDAQWERVKIEYEMTRFQPRSTDWKDSQALDALIVDPTTISPEATVAEMASQYSFELAPDFNLELAGEIPWDGAHVIQMVNEGKIAAVRWRPQRAPQTEEVVKHVETLMLRGADLAGSRAAVIQEAGHPEIDRWRSIGPEIKMLTASSYTQDPNDKEWITEVAKAPFRMNNMQEQALNQQMALGCGFAARIRDITGVSLQDGRIVLEARFQMWWEDQSTCRLVIDEHHLVREAEIHCDVRGNKSDFYVSNSGLFEAEGRFQCAKSGTFRRTAAQSGNTVKHFQLDVQRVSFDFTDEEFNQFAALDPPAGAKKTFLIDHDAPPPAPKIPQPVDISRVLLVVVNVAALVALVAAYLWRRRWQQRIRER